MPSLLGTTLAPFTKQATLTPRKALINKLYQGSVLVHLILPRFVQDGTYLKERKKGKKREKGQRRHVAKGDGSHGRNSWLAAFA